MNEFDTMQGIPSIAHSSLSVSFPYGICIPNHIISFHFGIVTTMQALRDAFGGCGGLHYVAFGGARAHNPKQNTCCVQESMYIHVVSYGLQQHSRIAIWLI